MSCYPTDNTSGAFYKSNEKVNNVITSAWYTFEQTRFDASRALSVYNQSSTVQPLSLNIFCIVRA